MPRAWAATILAVAGRLCACGRTDIGALYDLLQANRALQDRVAVILTADHGGTGNRHSEATDPFNYTIPFYVVGPGIAGNTDLYALVGETREDPGDARPPRGTAGQPIRNGDAGNLALEWLGLPHIPGSLMTGMRLVY